MRCAWRSILAAMMIVALLAGVHTPAQATSANDFPPELQETLARIAQGGPFPYRRDGSLFENREKRLPLRPRGYYREYTVPTPGQLGRGPRRVITGGKPAEIFYYTEDHYRNFDRLDLP